MEGEDGRRTLWRATAPRALFTPLEHDAECDVLVIGAGITGLTAAHELKKGGRRVVVIERGDIAHGTTGATTAHVTAMLDGGYAQVERRFGREAASLVARSMSEAIDSIQRTCKELGVSDVCQRVPAYYYAADMSGRDELKDEVEAARRAGLSAEYESQHPLVGMTQYGAAVLDGQLQIDAARYITALARAVDGGDCRVHTDTRALEIHEGEQCVVNTNRGIVRARSVVMATHTPVGLNVLHTEVAPYRSYVMAVRVDESIPDGLFWDTVEPYHYIRKHRSAEGELVLVGGMDHKTGSGGEREAFSRLEGYTRSHFRVREVAYRWSAQLYIPVDLLPFIGRSPFGACSYVATGFAGDGICFGTVAGTLIAELLLGRATRYAEVYSPTRIKPVAGARRFVKENLSVARHFVEDRLTPEEVRDLRDVAPGDGRLVQIGLRKIAAYRDEDGILYALRPVCSHMKCIVRWNGAEKSWDCPCHGTRYSVKGAVLEGPSFTGLDRYEMAAARQLGTASQPIDAS